MTGHLVVPTLTALTAENQPLAQFWAASCESWARLTPFAVQQVWRAGRPVPVSEKGSTLALLLEAAVQRITAAVTAPSG
jgi:hypothetical protein